MILKISLSNEIRLRLYQRTSMCLFRHDRPKMGPFGEDMPMRGLFGYVKRPRLGLILVMSSYRGGLMRSYQRSPMSESRPILIDRKSSLRPSGQGLKQFKPFQVSLKFWRGSCRTRKHFHVICQKKRIKRFLGWQHKRVSNEMVSLTSEMSDLKYIRCDIDRMRTLHI